MYNEFTCRMAQNVFKELLEVLGEYVKPSRIVAVALFRNITLYLEIVSFSSAAVINKRSRYKAASYFE